MMAEEDCYVIGIDFGTTYSGAAWCWSGQPDNVQLVTRWKTALSWTPDNAKTPTAIWYNPDDDGIQRWGYDIPVEVEPIRWFKLLLADDDQLEPDVRNSRQIHRAKQMIKQMAKTPVEVVADYLRLLWNHVLDDIIKDRGNSAVRGTPLKVWITVPAIWNDNACKRMRQAASLAGILVKRQTRETVLSLVAEPEAAAFAVLDDFQKRPDIKPNDIFVVCDAGGGTVDIISYTVLGTNPINVQECVEGKGKMCGAIFIDAAFEDMLKTLLAEKWTTMSDRGKKTMLNNEWEFGIKRLFDGSDKEWSVQIPLEVLAHNSRWKPKPFDKKGEIPMKEGQLKFKKGHIHAFFETVLPGIRGLIHGQIKEIKKRYNKAPKAILLVGGLGSCEYLFQQLQKEFEPKNIDVLQPNGARPWTAICRGAVIRGLSDSEVGAKDAFVTSRVSRVNYGTTVQAPWDEDRHDPQDKYWDSEEMFYRARNQMDWYLRRGEDVYTAKPISFEYYSLHKSEPQSIAIDVYQNDQPEAPKRLTESVKWLRTVKGQVRTPFEDLRQYTNPQGTVFRRVDYRVEMHPTGVSMKWRVLIDGQEIASEDVVILNE